LPNLGSHCDLPAGDATIRFCAQLLVTTATVEQLAKAHITPVPVTNFQALDILSNSTLAVPTRNVLHQLTTGNGMFFHILASFRQATCEPVVNLTTILSLGKEQVIHDTIPVRAQWLCVNICEKTINMHIVERKGQREKQGCSLDAELVCGSGPGLPSILVQCAAPDHDGLVQGGTFPCSAAGMYHLKSGTRTATAQQKQREEDSKKLLLLRNSKGNSCGEKIFKKAASNSKA